MLKCIESWQRLMPDYKIIEWNEQNFDVSENAYCAEAYHLKKYAFVSDYARLKIIYEHGGIYLDTDVELLKDLSQIITDFGFLSFERKEKVNTGLGFAAPSKSNVVKAMLQMYDDIHFSINGIIDNTPCPVRNTQALIKLGLNCDNTKQQIGDIIVYPCEYFCPMNPDSGELRISANTYSIHHYNYSWADEYSLKVQQRKRKVFAICPKWCAQTTFNIVNHIFKLFGK